MARRLPTILGLVLALTVGSLAVASRQPVRAATGDSVVLVWNQLILDTISTTKTAPTIAAQAVSKSK